MKLHIVRRNDQISKKYRKEENLMEPERCSPEEARQIQQELIVEEVIRGLKRNQIEGRYVRTRQEAAQVVLSMIPAEAKVGFGGSLTLDELGIKDTLRKGDFHFIDRNIAGLTPEQMFGLRRETLLCDIFLCSANAITRDGKLVNIDGIGNRLAALTFGPRKVIVVAGVNKIVKDLERALERVRDSAAPLNARRLAAKTPCVRTGTCSDCHSPGRICCITTIIEFQDDKDRMTVILVGEDLGL
jgi:L-lactate utilization protein LutB